MEPPPSRLIAVWKPLSIIASANSSKVHPSEAVTYKIAKTLSLKAKAVLALYPPRPDGVFVKAIFPSRTKIGYAPIQSLAFTLFLYERTGFLLSTKAIPIVSVKF